MDTSVGQTIERIKLQEQENEVKLREKREFNNAVLTTNRAIRDTLIHIGKLSKEYQHLTLVTDKLLHQLTVEKTRHSALIDQIESSCKELEKLREISNDGVSTVWYKRSKLLETTKVIAEKCDIWALLIKPSSNEMVPCLNHVQNNEQFNEFNHDDSNLKNALERRNKALAERNYLLSEPEIGEEFIRRLARDCRTSRSFSSKLENENGLASENEPIKFSTSQAARKTTKPLIRKVNTDMPWYQPFSVVGSVAVFLLYFCVLREENDIDREFDKTLYDRIKGLEKEQLLLSYRFNKEHGKSVDDIEKRLKELEEQENKLVA